jgi:type II secretory pathway component GspD/PulD (secretin)
VKKQVFVSIAVSFALAGTAHGQTPTPAKPAATPAAPNAVAATFPNADDSGLKAEQGTPLKLQFIVSKYQGEKKISSVPYVIATNANQRRPASLRVGAKVPIPMTAVGNGPAGSFNYENVGVSIDCSVFTSGQGLFRVEVNLDDSSIYMNDQTASPTGTPRINGAPTFRTFRITNSLVLKDGQTSQMTSAADPVTGDVMRIDLTLTVVK